MLVWNRFEISLGTSPIWCLNIIKQIFWKTNWSSSLEEWFWRCREFWKYFYSNTFLKFFTSGSKCVSDRTIATLTIWQNGVCIYTHRCCCDFSQCCNVLLCNFRCGDIVVQFWNDEQEIDLLPDTWLLSEMVCQWPGYGNSERLANNISILMHLGNDFVLLWINWNYKLE